MTTERGSFDEAGNVDAIVGTREDEMTSSGLSDAPSRPSSTTGTGARTTTSGSTTGTSTSGSGDRLQEAASGVADRVSSTAQQQVGGAVNEQLGRGADMLEQVTGAIRRSGEELRGEQPQIASFATTAADQVDRVAQYLRETDMQGLLRKAEDFARRQPAVFLGGAFALGILASRFMKASPENGGGYRGGFDRGYGRYGSTGYGSTGYGSSGYGSSGYGAQGGYRGTGSAGYGGATGRGLTDTSGLGGYGSGTTGTGATAGGTGTDAFGSAQANYAGSDTGPYGGDTGTRYAESGSGAATSDEGAERGGL